MIIIIMMMMMMIIIIIIITIIIIIIIIIVVLVIVFVLLFLIIIIPIGSVGIGMRYGDDDLFTENLRMSGLLWAAQKNSPNCISHTSRFSSHGLLLACTDIQSGTESRAR
ncbi:hypothetical protein DPMN_183617 [Dreissena polymorpha]|uniref:Uncharacterized protein n=1 Tax=Dreissena polymorpha TaxID=45954 RepID=A0A9D4I3R3_DREPO|nr:hypothetical protein DPMN_183617 [Dreissena polymorpha]